MKKDRYSLEQRLKELSETEYSGKISCGAMCYSIAAPVRENYVCPVCGHKTKQNNHIIWTIKDIRTIVAQMKGAGYDVILDEHEFCNNCSNRKRAPVKYPVLIFKIRYTPDSEYHIAESNFFDNYKCVWEFLKGNDFYLNTYDGTETLHQNVEVLQKMLGIGKDIIPPK
jgi:ribosomal protein L37AE/L43A